MGATDKMDECEFERKKGRRKSQGGSKRKAAAVARTSTSTSMLDRENSVDRTVDGTDVGVTISRFDYSVENYFRAMDVIYSLCGMVAEESFGEKEIQRFSSSITFLIEWKQFYYKPKTIRFAYEIGSPPVKDVLNGISLPQFSAATVPKMRLSSDTSFQNSSKDFLLQVGGPVWALDWCPRIDQRSDCDIKCEFLAVAAHPPDSSYHKIGSPLIGRGVIQLWCLLNVDAKEEPLPSNPRGRPRKKSTKRESLDNLNSADAPSVNMLSLVPAFKLTEDESGLPTMNEPYLGSGATDAGLEQEIDEGFSHGMLASKNIFTTPTRMRRMKDRARARARVYNDNNCSILTTTNQDKESAVSVLKVHNNRVQELDVSSQKVAEKGSFMVSTTSSLLPKETTLPRIVLCLAHNGKVAWDVKWRPSNADTSNYEHHMGYLAVLLGNGSLEVWDVPSLSMVKSLYSLDRREGTDPRFLKLEPVFKCSKMKCGDKQSIPLTVEWSPSAPHDLILAGCHDGMVALWKFSATGYSQDTRPLLCFTADSAPMRALAWAPDGSDPESANMIVTAGHGGLRFWDIRDPYRPLWDLNPLRRVVLSLDWLHEPRCIVASFDDGTLRILSLSKAAYNVPVTGRPFVGTQQQGLHSYYCSSFTIWSVQVSRLTGMVAYCSSDGSTLRFQLTRKAVEKDPSRNRAPHFLCGSLTKEDSTLTINTSLPNSPFPMKKSLNEWADTPRSIRGFLSNLNQAKRAHNQIPALCYGDVPAMDLGTGNSWTDSESKTMKRPKMGSKKKPGPSQRMNKACMLGDEEQESSWGRDTQMGESKAKIEVFPPKIVAMHRVRWNMNKGSERWLCYGGAAGIIRCQEIEISSSLKI